LAIFPIKDNNSTLTSCSFNYIIPYVDYFRTVRSMGVWGIMDLIMEIDDLREKLHAIIQANLAHSKQALSSDPVVKCSQELDSLIEQYYARIGKPKKGRDQK